MRRRDREITDFNEMVKIIEKCDVCRLALHDEEYPYIYPANFGMEIEDGKVVLYFHGALKGKKYDLMEKDNRVCFEMDCSHELYMDTEEMECTMRYESVIGQGHIEMIPDEKKYEALCILMKQYHQEDFKFGTKVMPATRVYKLVVEKMTGKRLA